VSDEETLEAEKLLASTEGLFVEPSSATAVAALRKLRERGTLDRKSRVCCLLTGTGFKDMGAVKSLVSLPNVISALEFRRRSRLSSMDAEDRDLLSRRDGGPPRPALHSGQLLRKLVEDGSADPPTFLCGFTALTEGRFEEAVNLCHRAILRDGRRVSDLYLNLGRVLSMSRRRGEAIVALTEGLALHPEDRRLRSELRHLVPRAKPAFPSLPRRHPLNKYAGIVRTVGARLWVTFIPQVRRRGRVSPRPAKRDRRPLPPPG
jgi:tetratricopeptide (TPR) repeat protein